MLMIGPHHISHRVSDNIIIITGMAIASKFNIPAELTTFTIIQHNTYLTTNLANSDTGRSTSKMNTKCSGHHYTATDDEYLFYILFVRLNIELYKYSFTSLRLTMVYR